MIWHIFRKDWKLLWPLVLLIAFAQATATTLWWLRDHDRLPDYLLTLSNLFPLVAILGSAILSISAIHMDPISGDCEDWLVRPIRRSDLLAAKLLFVVLAVLAPVFLIGMSEALSDGFPLAASTTVAFAHIVSLLVAICFPAMIMGAITGNAMEVLAGIAASVAMLGPYLVVTSVLGLHPTLAGYGNTTISGVSWMGTIVSAGFVILTGLIILPLQYFRRYTALSRLLALPLLMLVLSSHDNLPWKVAFWTQQQLTSSGSASGSVAISYDPTLKRSSRTTLDAGVRGPASLINLPIRVDGVSAGDVLLADRAEIRLIADGKVLYHQLSAVHDYSANVWGTSETMLRQNGASGGALHGYQVILLPVPVFDKVRARDLTLEIDYSLSLFHKDATATFAALNDSKHVANIGWCRTKIDDDGDEVVVQCVQPGKAPICGSAALQNPATNRRDPETFVCAPDYAPFPFRVDPDEMSRFFLPMKFKDIGNDENYPVNESQLGGARVNLVTYRATAHFTRHVVIQNIRLADWEANNLAAATSTLQK